jgi:hypothetical protein
MPRRQSSACRHILPHGELPERDHSRKPRDVHRRQQGLPSYYHHQLRPRHLRRGHEQLPADVQQ